MPDGNLRTREGKIVIALQTSDLIVGSEPMLVNTGNSFIVIPVKSDTILAGVAPDQDAINQISEKLGLIGYYLFAMSPDNAETVATTRMFAPRYAITEESATGMAAVVRAKQLSETFMPSTNSRRGRTTLRGQRRG